MSTYKEENKYLEECIARIAYGDLEAFEDFYNVTKKAVYGVALSYVKNVHDAEDIMHDVFIKVFEKAQSYVALGKPYAWVLTITKNLSITKIRKSQEIVNIDGMIDELKVEYDLTSENKIVLKSLFETLTDEERIIMMLHSLTGLKHREIGELLEKPMATVITKYNRTLKKLKKLCEKGEF